MRKKFSTMWKSSRQPRKQRKYIAKAPLHIKKKLMSVNLSKELRKKYHKRAIALREKDTVKIMKGEFKGKKGKVIKVILKKQRAEVEGIQVKKQDGSKANVKLNPSNLQIIELNLDDKKRIRRLNKETGKHEAGREKTKEIKEEKIKKTKTKPGEKK